MAWPRAFARSLSNRRPAVGADGTTPWSSDVVGALVGDGTGRDSFIFTFPSFFGSLSNIVLDLAAIGGRHEADRTAFPINKRFMDVFLQVAEDLEVGHGSFAREIRVEPGA